MQSKAPKPVVSYYNGACPVCNSEMNRYRRHGEACGAALDWVDISDDQNKDALIEHGITQDMAYRRIYVLDENGKPQSGVDGLIAIWRNIPRWAFLAKLIALPIVRPILGWLYEHVLARGVYTWNKLRLNRHYSKKGY